MQNRRKAVIAAFGSIMGAFFPARAQYPEPGQKNKVDWSTDRALMYVTIPPPHPQSFTLDLPGNKPEDPLLTVTLLGEKITLTTQEVLEALKSK